MHFYVRLVVCIAVGVGVLSGWNGVSSAQAEEPSPAQLLENKVFAELAQPEAKKVSFAVIYFMQHKTPAAKVVPRVLPMLKIEANDDNENNVLSHLARLLEHFGTEANAAIPQLIEIAAKADQVSTRERAKNALAKIGPHDERVFAALRNTLLAPREPGDVVTSAQALVQMGPIATRAIPELNRQIRELEKTRASQYFGVRAAHRVYHALGEIALKKAPLPSLDAAMKTLRKIDQVAPDESILAFLSLQRSDRSAASAVPHLLSIIARGEEYSAGTPLILWVSSGRARTCARHKHCWKFSSAV